MRIDLHNHTIHSDGVLTEEELIKRAVMNNVDVFALTDHDSIYGCDNIVEISKKYNVRVIKGMELSTTYKGESIHIVCLFKDNIIPKEKEEGIFQIFGHTQLKDEPIITDKWACLDCKKGFIFDTITHECNSCLW